MRPDVREFAWDDQNEAKVFAHGIDPESVDDVLIAGRYAVFENRRGLPGSYQLIGRDFNGRFITVIIEPQAGTTGLWRPRTAWPSKRGEITKARKQGVR